MPCGVACPLRLSAAKRVTLSPSPIRISARASDQRIADRSMFAGPLVRLNGELPLAPRKAMRGIRISPRRPSGPALSSGAPRSEEHTSELQSLMRSSYAVFCLQKNMSHLTKHNTDHQH